MVLVTGAPYISAFSLVIIAAQLMQLTQLNTTHANQTI